MSLIIFSFNVYFKMAASIGSHLKNRSILMNKNPIFMQFASKCAVFRILLDRIHLYFYVPFPLIRQSIGYSY